MSRRPPPPEDFQWQTIVPSSPSNGGWAMIMHGRLILHYPRELWLCGAAGIERVFDDTVARLAKHGEPPLNFKRVWMLSQGSLFWWRAHDDRSNWRHPLRLSALRDLWRETFGSEPLALPSPNDTPAGDDRRRAARPASAGRHLPAMETACV